MRDEQLEERGGAESDFLYSAPIARPRIFEGLCDDDIPPGFDAVTIHLDGRVQADLQWNRARNEALFAIERGLGVMWALDLGLFAGLNQSLTNQGQFLSLSLSVEHFRDSLGKEFKDHTIGVSFYRGAADFSLGFSWDVHQEQNFLSWLKENCSLDEGELSVIKQSKEGRQLQRLFCRDVAIEYLSLLASRLPDTLAPYLFLDASSLTGTYSDHMQYMNPERFDRFLLAIKHSRLPFETIGWGTPTPCGYSGEGYFQLPESMETKIGVCIPPMNFNRASHYAGFEEVLDHLQRFSLPYKLIGENALTAKWDGLDYLIYSPTGLSIQGKRKLQGFNAAGGIAVSIGKLAGLTQELSLQEWLRREPLETFHG